MPPRQRDVKVRILSEYYDAGSKAAERATRRLAQVQMAAANEDIAREQAKAAAIVAANRRQADAMDHVGRSVLMVSAAIAVGLGLSAKAAMDWESAFAGVRKVVDGSPEQIAALEGELRGLAKVLPATHEEIALVAEAAGQLGVARQDVAAFTRTAIDMGETTNMAADEAATSMAQLGNIMGVGADQASRMGSAIVALGNDGASTERDIVSMALRIAGAGRSVGMTTDQVLSIASALSSVGLESEAGGSAISRVILQIDKDVSRGADTLATYAQVSGKTVDEFTQQWGTDATGALTSFITGLGQVQATGGNVNGVLDTLGITEIRTSDALRRAALAGDLLTDALDTGSRAWAENNALTKEAELRYATTESRLQIARNQINDAAIDIGGNLLPALAGAATGAGSLAAGFGELSPTTKTWVTTLGLVAMGVTGVVGASAIAIPKLAALKTNVDALHGGSSKLGSALGGVTSFLTGPWGLALGGATIALGVWMKAQGEAAQKTRALSDTLDAQTGALTDASTAWIQAELTKSQSFGLFNDQTMVDAAEELGISIDTLTGAYMGEAAAMSEAKAAADAYRDSDTSLGLAKTSLASIFISNIDDQNARLQTAQEIQAAKARIDQEAADRQGEVAQQYGIVSGSIEDQNAVLEDGRVLVEDAAAAIETLSKALDELNSPALDAREAERRFQEAIDGVNEAIAAQVDDLARQYEASGMSTDAARARAEAEVAVADKLDVGTEAGRRNQEALDGIAEASMRRANAILEQTGSEDAFRTSLDEGRTALFEQARQFFDTDAEAQAYVDTVLAIPPSVVTTADLKTETAQADLDNLIARNQGRLIRLTAEISASGNPIYVTATGRKLEGAGDILEFMAGGGLRPMAPVAQMVPPNTWRVVGDRSDVPELYAPLDRSQRSRELWETAGQMMGWGGSAAAPTVTVTVPAPSIVGARIEGTVDLGNGLTGYLRAVVKDELADVGSHATYRGRP